MGTVKSDARLELLNYFRNGPLFGSDLRVLKKSQTEPRSPASRGTLGRNMKTSNTIVFTLALSASLHAQSVQNGDSAPMAAPRSNAPMNAALSQAVAAAFSPVMFNNSGTLTQDSTSFVWDATNHRLGLGNPFPANRLDILGGSIRLNSGRSGPEAYTLSGRVGIGFPVPYFTPATNNSVIAFDVYPKGTPSNFSGNTGVAWFDLCSTDVNLNLGYECLRMGKFASGDAHVSVAAGGTGVLRNLDLQINGGRVGIGTTSPAALLSVGPSSQFQVDSNGNIAKLNNVRTKFPAANAPGFLTNDGAGNFYYTPTTSAMAFTAATLPNNPPLGTVAKISDGLSISDCRSGSGTAESSCEWNGNAWVFHPTGGYVLSAQPGPVDANSTSFAAPGVSTVAPIEQLKQYVVAKSCRVSNIYMNVGVDQPATGNLIATLRVAHAGAPPTGTDVTATVPAGAPAGTVVSDTSHTADLAAGDLVSIRLVNTADSAGNVVTINMYCAY